MNYIMGIKNKATLNNNINIIDWLSSKHAYIWFIATEVINQKVFTLLGTESCKDSLSAPLFLYKIIQ